MNRFKQIIENGYKGFNTQDAREIIRDSAEVTRYVETNRKHFSYVQQLMNDRIIDEAMGRVKSKGKFEYNENDGFVYCRDNSRCPRPIITEQYPSQRVYPRQNQQDNVMARLVAMEREMNELREENRQLKNRYENLK